MLEKIEQLKPPLQTQYNFLFRLIKDARNTNNPFKAKELKNQIEPLLEQFASGAVDLMTRQAEQIKDLQIQIGRLYARLSDLGV